MAGIYFHIPFCRTKCNYCDFYSKRDPNGIDQLVASEINEVIYRKNYVNNEVIKTIYFGGGTPSLLNKWHLSELLSTVRGNFDISDDCEISFEANPDDLSENYLLALRDCGINRLSIGIQSFNDDILRFLGRRHDSKRLTDIIGCAQNTGFINISADLIFGIPRMEYEVYLDSLYKLVSLDIQHISAYSLTIERGTRFYKMLEKNLITEVIEDEILKQYEATVDVLADHGFIQYEISNYAREGFKSRHNSSYWENELYLGIGPSAHSFNKLSRQWNISNTRKYCDFLSSDKPYFEIEYLTLSDKYNEYVITGLRTSVGVSMQSIKMNFSDSIAQYFEEEVLRLVKSDLIYIVGDQVILTKKGVLISDYILRQLYYV